MDCKIKSLFFATLFCLSLSLRVGAQKPEVIVQNPHFDVITSVSFSPDGRVLASASRDGKVQLRDANSGHELRTLSFNPFCRAKLIFSPNSKILAGVSDGTYCTGEGEPMGEIIFWDVTTGRVVNSIKAASINSAELFSAVFSLDGSLLAIVNQDSSILIWGVNGRRPPQRIRPSGKLLTIAFGAGSKTIVGAYGDGFIRIKSVATGQEVRKFFTKKPEFDSDYYEAAISPDGKFVVNGAKQALELWEVSTGKRLTRYDGSKHASRLSFSADGRVLAGLASAPSEEDTIRLWDVVSGKAVYDYKSKHEGHVIDLAPSHDGRLLALAEGFMSVSSDLQIWVVADKRQSFSLRNSASADLLAASGAGNLLATANSSQFIKDNTVRVWDLNAGLLRKVLICKSGKSDFVTALAFSPTNKVLAGSCATLDPTDPDDLQIMLWDAESGLPLRKLYHGFSLVRGLAFSGDGKRLASLTNHHIIIWDAESGEQLYTYDDSPTALEAGRDAIGEMTTSVAFSGDGQTVAVGTRERVLVWKLGAAPQVSTLDTAANSLDFSPDGSTLATGDEEQSVKIWRVKDGSLPHILSGHTGPVYSVAYSPDGKYLASSSRNEIKVWECSTGKALHTISEGNQSNGVVSFTEDSRFLLGLVDKQNQIRLWEPATGRLRASLIANGGDGWMVVTPDGFFDGSPDAWKQILWRLGNDTFRVAPVEAFFADFFRPGLLQEVFRGEFPKADVDISRKDIRQPAVNVRFADGELKSDAGTAREVAVRVEVTDTLPDEKRPNTTGGARDVRLFRNGSLVRHWHDDAFAESSGCRLEQTPRGEPRRAVCEATVTVTAGENRLTAYAFNSDNVKSRDAELTLNGADSLRRGGTLYVVAAGVDRYQAKGFDLEYAVADAQEFGSALNEQQQKVRQYERVEVVTLADAEATKRNILLALGRLAAGAQGPLPAAAPKQLAALQPAEPEDAVVVFFAGHGAARGERFLLLPHDFSAATEEALRATGVSDEELNDALETVDAGRMLMVIDACQSGQALVTQDPRRGPMNSKGLAQLAYEKGMYILTAAQSDQAAFEVRDYGHGLLTYALVVEGLRRGKAQRNERGEITGRSWLDYVTEEVPRLQLAAMVKRAAEAGGARPAQAGQARAQLVFLVGDDPAKDPRQRQVQRPRVFYRRELEAQPLVVAKPRPPAP